MHWRYTEELRGREWFYTGRVPCNCLSIENHWTERPTGNDRQITSSQAA